MKNYILIFILFASTYCTTCVNAQGTKQITIGGAKTPLSNTAFNGQIKYGPEDLIQVYSGGLFSYAPEFAIESGNKDAFSVMSGKLSGFFMFFKVDTSGGVIQPDTRRFFHVLPVSAGFEAGNNFETLNAIVEIGYMPQYSRPNVENIPNFIKKYTRTGLFLQGGYKYASVQQSEGGKMDQSKESVKDVILRAKARVVLDSKYWLRNRNTGFGLGFTGTSDTWYDFLNSQVYYRIEGRMSLYLSRDYSFDFYYEKGSGAPNFNQGEQFGAGLSVTF
jgi:hypothetical protein